MTKAAFWLRKHGETTSVVLVCGGAVALIVAFLAKMTDSNLFMFASLGVIAAGVALYLSTIKRKSKY